MMQQSSNVGNTVLQNAASHNIWDLRVLCKRSSLDYMVCMALCGAKRVSAKCVTPTFMNQMLARLLTCSKYQTANNTAISLI